MSRVNFGGSNRPLIIVASSVALLVVLMACAWPGRRTPIANHVTKVAPVTNLVIACKEPVFDFGRIQCGGNLEVNFPITNICGQAALVKVVQSCACLLKTDTFLIQPSDTYHLSVTMNLSNVHGALHRTIRLKTLALVPPAPRPVTWPVRLIDDVRMAVVRTLSRPCAVLHQ